MRISWTALAILAATTSAHAGSEAEAINIGTAAIVTLLGHQAPGSAKNEKPSNVEYHAGQKLRGGDTNPCGAGEVEQSYPGWQGTACRVSPSAASSPQHPARTDKAGS